MLRSLLQRVPQDERNEAIKAAIESVGESGTADIGLTVSLAAELPDDESRGALQARLLELLQRGRTDLVLAVSGHNASLRSDLLRHVAQRLYGLTGELQHHPGEETAVSMGNIVPLPDCSVDLDLREMGPLEDRTDSIKHLLTFARSADIPGAEVETFDRLFKAALVLLGCATSMISTGARETLVSLLGASPHISHAHHQLVWLCLQKLLAQERSQGLAYAIWLRWVLCQNAELQFSFERSYWVFLQQGLQYGDAERRKQCLAILRRSVAIAASKDSSMAMICSRKDDIADRTSLVAQYERFRTVFETIVLGRYLNQVMECETDLSMLASTGSLVQAEWLYTLLASALHPKMQDSNRKFIGNWVMRSNFQPNASEAFVVFLRSAFLPWATQGSLFTSTLRKEAGYLHCVHGDRLAQYTQHLLQRNSSDSALTSSLIDISLDLLSARRSFAYANVYLLEGLARAFETTRAITLKLDQLEKLANLTSWAALPEVARDHVFVRCLKLCGDNFSRTSKTRQSELVVRSVTQWDQVQALLNRAASGGMPMGPVAAWQAEPSKRDIREDAALELCCVLQRDLRSVPRLQPSEIEAKLLEIWTDMEYLEYPKKLLVEFPGVLLDPTLVTRTVDYAELGKSVADMVRKLQAVSGNRAYLMSPLVGAVRLAVLAVPSAAAVLNVKDFLLSYAEGLPEPTVDLLLEDATTHVLQSVAPELKVVSYEYYFGPRETFGAAALLDMTSRLGSSCPEILVSLFNTLLERWTNQRVPPPTVSPWKSVLQLQLALLCCEQVLSHLVIMDILMQLHYILSIEPLPRFRYLLSWMIARIYVKHKPLKASLLTELSTKDHHSNPKYLASLMKIGVMLTQAKSADADFGLQLTAAVVPLAASSKVIIRHEAQWQFPVLMDVARSRSWLAITGNVAFAALDEYIRSLERFEQPPLERVLDRFDPVKDHTLTNLVEGPWYCLDNTEAPICRRADFVDLYRRDAGVADDWPLPCMPLGEPTVTNAPTTATPEVALSDDTRQTLTPSKAGESRALQTKGTAYMASALAADAKLRIKRNELIIIASLVDNPYNLGGLSRVSEVFGVSEMHLQNQNVTSNRDFQAVSVSSHLHLPLLQLSAAAVPPYLAAKRNEGWSIVGIEQTDRSVLLGSKQCPLPNRTILVLGSEKEGIPAIVLTECDMLVEIPQQGVTRSLNVQTAAAIVLYEYSRQHRVAEK